MAKSSAWTSHGKGKTGRFDRHDATGWEIHHCGHPTANWPWYAISPSGEHFASDGGYAWRTLGKAHEHVEDLIAGKRVGSQRFFSAGYTRAVLVCFHPECSEVADVTADSYRYGKPACAAHELEDDRVSE
jgi:hypothetical protein